MKTHLLRTVLAATSVIAAASAASASPEDDRRAVAALDLQYQEAVKRNDAETMGRILDEHFVLVLGNGTVYQRTKSGWRYVFGQASLALPKE